VTEDFRTLYCDPGEDFGFCWGKGFKLLGGGIEKMWPITHEVFNALDDPGTTIFDGASPLLRAGITAEDNSGPFKRIVCEDFRIYPNKYRSLIWNPVRTARVIGALTFFAQKFDLELVFQPASIKSTAEAAGAEELFYHPLHENRHVNDAIMHFFFYTNGTMRNIEIPVPNQGVEPGENRA
jgi:hypothetical protein